ncbi:MAG: replicative DNA helicase [Clostridiales bacterium]|uniref:Replicative DNA helicase n=1 Tax=Candidatus Scybalenecus merdavium TaxID=2840939 RepID=A0A9D1MV73_9FIRM|nr:replicative DNA helicase [Clostridiales bacterium]HIU69254.1 replicative DNA helicase [Candidatus Scubalenecus merdavium]
MSENFSELAVSMPFDKEAEQSLLGSVLVDNQCMDTVSGIVKPDYFYLPAHRAIYSSMLSMFMGGHSAIDPVIIADALVKENLYDLSGGKQYLLQLAQIVPSTANVESYARIVREKYYLRRLIEVSQKIAESASSGEGGADVILDSAEQMIYDIRQGKETNAPTKVSRIIFDDVITKLEKLSGEEKEQYMGIPSGFYNLDKCITGLNKSDFILIGARPAMGKTSFALNLAHNVTMKAKKKCVFFCLEMSKMQLAERLLASQAGINAKKFRTGELTREEWVQLANAAEQFENAELYIDDTSSITVPEIKSRVRKLRDVDMIIVDYLGLIQGSGRTENRVQEVSQITRSLKMLAKDLNIPVVVCAQLSRGTEGRGKSHRPQLADLRESGSIEQDADIVMFLYREAYYDNERSAEEQEEIDNSLTELIVAKNRHGETGTIKLAFDSEFTRFRAVDEDYGTARS